MAERIPSICALCQAEIRKDFEQVHLDILECKSAIGIIGDNGLRRRVKTLEDIAEANQSFRWMVIGAILFSNAIIAPVMVAAVVHFFRLPS